ncbi:MAG TPA: hypothetical protein DCZ94_06105 [Lentisphaeria bacterium]|nr:MAG: hypothetical protein A2X48_21945 [Lentisphaerae bacterium GWF2_49_21]HBC86510.1 hypothetical protein [Lentisphaeria bacterium]
MNKSLAPLIISFAVIILLTFIIINSKPKGSAIELQTNGSAPTMTLSQGNKAKFRVAPTASKGRHIYVPETEKTLEDAKKSLSAGKEGEAEDSLRTLLVFEPDNQQALSLLGGIFYYSQRYSEAEMIFRRQIKLTPDNDSVYNHLGSVLAKQSKMQEAVTMTIKAIELNPKSSDAQINLASMYASMGDTESCMKHLLASYQLIGYSILPFTYDQTFDKVRSSPEFQELIIKAKKDADTRLKFDRIPGTETRQKDVPQVKTGK